MRLPRLDHECVPDFTVYNLNLRPPKMRQARRAPARHGEELLRASVDMSAPSASTSSEGTRRPDFWSYSSCLISALADSFFSWPQPWSSFQRAGVSQGRVKPAGTVRPSCS